jgi:hypothetical protein
VGCAKGFSLPTQLTHPLPSLFTLFARKHKRRSKLRTKRALSPFHSLISGMSKLLFSLVPHSHCDDMFDGAFFATPVILFTSLVHMHRVEQRRKLFFTCIVIVVVCCL